MKGFLKERPGHPQSNKENCELQLMCNFEKKLKGGEKAGRRKEKDAFVERVNGYIETISLQNRNPKAPPRASRQLFEGGRKQSEKGVSRNSSRDGVASLSRKLKNEREINKNLQKCIIEIQKILWERSDRLEALEEELSCVHQLRENHEQYERNSDASSKRMRTSESELKRYANSLGLKRILHSLNNEEIEETSEYSDTKNSPSEASSLDCQKSYIKIERPRTESESELPSKRRK